MGELDRLLKLTKKPFPPLPSIVKETLEIFLLKEEREFLNFLEKRQELKRFIIETTNLPQFRKDNPPISDLRKAILILGEDLVKLLVLSFLSHKLKKTTFNEFSFDLFWARAIANLGLSNLLTSHIENYPTHLHVASFLMDYGVLVLYQVYPEGYLQVLKLKKLGKTTLDAEREVFGVDHATIGAEYFENYNFPRRFVLDLYHHHRITGLPEEIPQDVLYDIKILNLIDSGIGAYFSTKKEHKYQRFQEVCQEVLNLSQTEATVLLDSLPGFINQFYEILGYETYKLIPYTEWIKKKEKKIKEQLQKIEEQEKEEKKLLEIYKQELARVLREKELLLKQLEKTEEALKKQTFFDPLTGLYNEEYFLLRLKEEFLRAKRYQRIFSVLFFEIEKGEEIAETQSLKGEEIFIKLVAENLASRLRRVDVIAKLKNPYRFGVILPETPLSGAMVVARKLLQTLENLSYKTFNLKKSAFIVAITYDPKQINPKTDPNVELILRALEKGLEILKEKQQRRILSMVIDKEIEAA